MRSRGWLQFVDQVAARNVGDSFVKEVEERAAVTGKAEGKFSDQVAAKNVGDSYIKSMGERATAKGQEEGKFSDQVASVVRSNRHVRHAPCGLAFRHASPCTPQVASRNVGTSYIKEMEARATKKGAAEGKFTDQVYRAMMT